MGKAKEEIILSEEAKYTAAKRDGRTCPFCGAVIPYGVEPGPHGEGPECMGSLKDDD